MLSVQGFVAPSLAKEDTAKTLTMYKVVEAAGGILQHPGHVALLRCS